MITCKVYKITEECIISFLGQEADHSPPSCTKIKTECSSTSAPLYKPPGLAQGQPYLYLRTLTP